MRRLPVPARAAIVGAAWIASLYLIDPITDNRDAQTLLGIAFTLAAGLAAGTWWILLAPAAAALVFLAADPINPCDDCREELGLAGSVLVFTLGVLLVDVVLAAGVGARKLAARMGSGRAGSA